MRALVPTKNLAEMVRLSNVAELEPAANEVIVAVEAFSINRGETFLLENPQPGWRPGKDVVGHPPAKGWAEVVAIPTDRLAIIPETMDAAVAAALPLAGLTALRLLRDVGSFAGRRMLITGAWTSCSNPSAASRWPPR